MLKNTAYAENTCIKYILDIVCIFPPDSIWLQTVSFCQRRKPISVRSPVAGLHLFFRPLSSTPIPDHRGNGLGFLLYPRYRRR